MKRELLTPYENAIVDDLLENNHSNFDFESITLIENFESIEFLVPLIAKFSIELCTKLFTEIFEDLSTEKAKLLSSNSCLNAVGCINNFNALSLHYGEIEFTSFINLIQSINPTEGSVFVDLGHGTGKTLISLALVFGSIFSSIHGIEIIPELVTESRKKIFKYQTLINSELYKRYFNESNSNCLLSAEEGDFLALHDDHSKSLNRLNNEALFDWTTAGFLFLFLLVFIIFIVYCKFKFILCNNKY
jgi:hypothetical protein